MKYDIPAEFFKRLQALPKNIQAKFAKTLLLFIQDPFHPSLHTKKMKGRVGVWECRIHRAYRFTFHYEINERDEKVCRFRNIGPHDILDTRP